MSERLPGDAAKALQAELRRVAQARRGHLARSYRDLAHRLSQEAARLDRATLDGLLTSRVPPARRMSAHTLAAEDALDEALDAIRKGAAG